MRTRLCTPAADTCSTRTITNSYFGVEARRFLLDAGNRALATGPFAPPDSGVHLALQRHASQCTQCAQLLVMPVQLPQKTTRLPAFKSGRRKISGTDQLL